MKIDARLCILGACLVLFMGILAPFSAAELVLHIEADDSLADFIATDSSGKANHAHCSASNCPVFVLGGSVDGSGAYDFNGTADVLEIFHNQTLNLGNVMSLSVLIKPTTVSIPFQSLLVKGNLGTAPRAYSLYLQGDEVQVSWHSGIFRSFSTVNQNLQQNQWHHLAYVRNGTHEQIFIDGFLVAEQVIQFSMLGNTNSLFLGRVSNSEQFDGLMDDIRIYNHSLTASEVNSLAVLPVCGNTIVEPTEECDDGNQNNDDDCLTNCLLPTIPFASKTCTGAGDLYLYQGDVWNKKIATSFVVNHDQLLVFTRDAALTAKKNGAPAALSQILSVNSPFAVQVYLLNTTPGDLVTINGTHLWNARSVQGFLAQDSSAPAYDISTLQIIFDDDVVSEFFQNPGDYSYMFLDKYSDIDAFGTPDNRLLRVKIEGTSGTLVDQSFTQPFPSPIEGAVVNNYSIIQNGAYRWNISTEDSVYYWMFTNCSEQEPFCGDGNVDQGEECDDGNQNNDDLCRNGCTFPFCGDGLLDNGELCDDGNNADNDGCNADCLTEFCGDSVVQANESCDDGNQNNFDACRNNCNVPFCGDAIQDFGEFCDDGNQDNNDGCKNDCSAPVCGDGFLDFNEQCDDGNQVDGDGCNANCENEFCGDGIQQTNESCDDGNQVNEDNCRNDCTFPFCGDGIIGPGESCDDGNQDNFDACSNACTPNECDPGQGDEDNDGVGDQCDECADSLAFEVVDENGCDPFQFCRKFNCGNSCFFADFNQDEPNSEKPLDCTVVVKSFEGVLRPLCVPVECRAE